MDQYIGRLLDNRYEILEIIGTGGMAVVYKARCHRLNRLVAVKILKDEYFRDEEFRRRFHHEGEAVAMLSHPNIVQVYDVSSTDNEDFIVMELIDGITLKQYMEKKGTLNWKETLHFSMQMAKALEHAHGRSIVHRDIKPHNIMVLKNGSVKVTDFGIARVMSKSNTLTKEALGSVHYISPEQAKGGWVDNRSDLYSLGVVMYEMMTGRPPYDGESPVAVAIQHINGGAAMPSTLNPNIPNGLEQIIMRAMALDTNERYPSATEMLKDMEEFRKDPSVLFLFPQHGVGGETKVLPSTAVVAEAARQKSAKTTAEKVAQAAAGNAGAATKARAATTQQKAGQSIDPPKLRQNEIARSRTAVSAGDRRMSDNARRLVAAEAAATAVSRRNSGRNLQQVPNRQTREAIREEIREEERNRMATIAVVSCSAVAIIAIVIFLILLVNGVLFDQSETLVLVDNFVGEYYDDDIPNSRGLEIVVGGSRHDDNVEKGKILDQRPAYGSKVVPGSKVTVIISLGPEPAPNTMENLVGYDYKIAEEFLRDLGMKPLPTEEFNDTVSVGKVIRTDPAAGAPLAEGQTVKIYYSKGPLIEKAEMPYVVGQSYDTAYNLLTNLGFVVKYQREESNEPKDEVIAQSVKEGEMVDITEKIVLTISKGPQTVTQEMPHVVGMEYDEAHDKLTDLGFTNVDYEREDSDQPKNEVIAQPIKKGTKIDVTTRIVLTISKGPKETEPPQEVSKSVTIELPQDRMEDYMVSVHLAGKVVIEDRAVTGGTVSIQVTLTGTGTQHFDVYINDDYYKTVKVEFT